MNLSVGFVTSWSSLDRARDLIVFRFLHNVELGCC